MLSLNQYGVSVLSAATAKPVSTEQARKQLELIGITEHDEHLDRLVINASEIFRSTTQCQLSPQKEQLVLRRWKYPILIPVHPTISIDKVEYYDADNVLQTLDQADYGVNWLNMPHSVAEVMPNGTAPPLGSRSKVLVSYTAGFENNVIPANAQEAILQLVVLFFRSRQPVTGVAGDRFEVPFSAVSIMDSYKLGDMDFVYA